MAQMQNAAVVGHPIGHTMSPFLHERLFKLKNMPMSYKVLDMPVLEDGIDELRRLDCFNVTIPHKTGIIPFLTGMDEKAAACGSVNSVRIKNGKLYGTTTDGSGCYRSLAKHGLDFSGPLLLLGNGGAARSIAFEIAARQKGFQVTIACREGSMEKASILAEELSAYAERNGDSGFSVSVSGYRALEKEETSRYSLLLNTTSVGMYPHTGISPVPESVISRCSAVFDAVFNPGQTELMRLAQHAGVQAIGGMEMLVYQAVEAHRFWYGWSFREEDISQLCTDAERAMQELF